MPALRDADETAQLDAFLAATPVPLTVRSLDEMAALAQKEAEAQQEATVIRAGEEADHTKPAWVRKKERERSSSSSSTSSEAELKKEEPTTDGAAKREPDPPSADEGINVIKNEKGVTVLLTHAGVIFKKERKLKDKRERPQDTANTAEANHPAEKSAAVDTSGSADSGGVELKSREELRRLVSEWRMSNVLLEAVLIGLEPPPSVVQLPEDYDEP
ncbi:hypothetical protein STCU_10736 [Strigomonas culicis]|uniref:Uncharacterized protein n=1 Tax=Strigomonas culicis TaxID=28005 RepID=S9TK81_9TRYP|nr:hypothetical protein STCU_10736 [Strigomonas culicis]|eukprot:EPY17239.1 hypothetical protein STCU_10736 [Strigomonas culicis]